MPSTVTQTRPDQAAGFQHIAAPANALVERLNKTQHPNVVAMHDAIDGWVKEANRRGGDAGIEYLSWCSARIENNRSNHESYALGRGKLAKGNEGLGPFDFMAAADRINNAARILSGEGA